MLLHSSAYVAEMVTLAALLDPQLQTFFGDADQFQLLLASVSDRNRSRRIPNEPIERYANIDRKNVAILQLISRGKAVHDLLVNRSAN